MSELISMNNNFTLNDQKKSLLKLVFNDYYDIEQINFILKDIDIANENFYYLLTLGNFASKHNWEGIDEKYRNWIRGILQQTKLRNGIHQLAAKLFIKELTSNIKDCIPILIKDLPFVFHYDIESSRVCYDIPCVIKPKDTEKAWQFAKNINTSYNYPFTQIKIFNDYSEYGIKNSKTKRITVNNCKVLIPCAEEALVMLYNYYLSRILDKKDYNLVFKAYYDGLTLCKECEHERFLETANQSTNKDNLMLLFSQVQKLRDSWN